MAAASRARFTTAARPVAKKAGSRRSATPCKRLVPALAKRPKTDFDTSSDESGVVDVDAETPMKPRKASGKASRKVRRYPALPTVVADKETPETNERALRDIAEMQQALDKSPLLRIDEEEETLEAGDGNGNVEEDEAALSCARDKEAGKTPN